MKKNILTPILCIIAFGIGVSVNNAAMSDISNSKIAYVDINKLVSASKVISQAQTLREKQTHEMLKWYDSANIDIQKQTTKENKEALIKKYETQLSQKKKTIKDNYSKDIKKADVQMQEVISKKAKDLGYTFVFRKDALLVGGDDITSEVLPLVK